MAHHHGLRIAMLGTLALSVRGRRAGPRAGWLRQGQAEGPEAEVRKSEVKVSLPGVPAFDLPPSPTDGSHSVKEMRVKGKKLLETDVTVKGVITWAYDCPTAIRQPGVSADAVQKLIDEDPSKCERPKFYNRRRRRHAAGEEPVGRRGPAPLLQIELERLPREEIRHPPSDRCDAKDSKDTKKSACPPYKVGDQVEITGPGS